VPHERTRTRARAIAGLVDYARGLPRVERLAVLHSTTPDLAADLVGRFGTLLPPEQIVIAQFSPVLGTHVGPGAIGVAVDEGEVG
jgi:fatty acid-binding protein DegV